MKTVKIKVRCKKCGNMITVIDYLNGKRHDKTKQKSHNKKK